MFFFAYDNNHVSGYTQPRRREQSEDGSNVPVVINHLALDAVGEHLSIYNREGRLLRDYRLP